MASRNTVFLEAQNGFEKGAETSSVDFYAQLDEYKAQTK